MRIARHTLIALSLLAVATGCGSEEPESSAPPATDVSVDEPTTESVTTEPPVTEPEPEPMASDVVTAEAAVSDYPVTVTADNGDVDIAEQPFAIVSLSPSLTEMLYAIGAGDQVIAVDTSSSYPADAPVTDLSGFRPNVEAIGDLQPDLVLLARDRDDVAATLTAVGIPTAVLGSAADITDVDRQIRLLGAATGHSADADALADEVTADVAELLASLPERDEPLSYFYELSPNYDTTTSDTFIGSLLHDAGLVNIADGVDPAAGVYPQLSAEFVLEQNPDLIFVAYTDGSVPTIESLAERPGWGELAAIANGHVVFLDTDISSRWGPRVVDLARQLVDAVAGADAE